MIIIFFGLQLLFIGRVPSKKSKEKFSTNRNHFFCGIMSPPKWPVHKLSLSKNGETYGTPLSQRLWRARDLLRKLNYNWPCWILLSRIGLAFSYSFLNLLLSTVDSSGLQLPQEPLLCVFLVWKLKLKNIKIGEKPPQSSQTEELHFSQFQSSIGADAFLHIVWKPHSWLCLRSRRYGHIRKLNWQVSPSWIPLDVVYSLCSDSPHSHCNSYCSEGGCSHK